MLPDLPYTPDMPSFDEVSLVRDTLPAHNAREMISQGLTQVGPRPTAPVINMPQISVPESQPLSEFEQIMGGGFGQGVVPNGPRPAPATVSAPAISLDQSYLSQDYNLADYDLTWDGLSPEGQYLRPTSPLELYNFDSGPDVSGLERMKPEQLMGKINAHQPQANTGGDPVFEAEMTSIRPTNPRQFFASGLQVVVPETPQQIPVRDLPVICSNHT